MGLINGKMGIVFFMYHYAYYTNNELYNDFAGDLLDEIMKSSAHIPVDIENGLIGVGWGVNYLMKKGFIDGDPNDVLQNVDTRIFSSMVVNPLQSVLGQGLYLLSRINMVNNIDNKLDQQISILLNFCYNQLRIEHLKYSLYYLNSVLHFLLRIDHLGLGKKYNQLALLRKLIPDIIKKTLDQKTFDNNDLFLFNKILDSISYQQKNKWNKILQLKNHVTFEIRSEKNIVEDLIKNTWLSLIYFNNCKENIKPQLPTEGTIYKFIKEKQESLTINDFIFNQGLAGLGFTLLNSCRC
jgi:hypothetical protein